MNTGSLLNTVGNTLLSPPRTCFGTVAIHGDRKGNKIALTFDDGPGDPSSNELLDVLGELAIPSTFFLVGSMVERYPAIAKRMVDEGHTIGNHSMFHARSGALRPFGGVDHIVASAAAIEAATGRAPALYRPPWGWLTPWEARRLKHMGLTVVGWDVYPDDWKWPEVPSSVVTSQVVAKARRGSIILMHDARPYVEPSDKRTTTLAVRDIWRTLSVDYEFTTVDRLLGIEPYKNPIRSTT